MSALAEALLAAQRQAIGAAAKAFVAGQLNDTELLDVLDNIGATEKVEQGYLLAALHVAQQLGVAPTAQANGKPEPENEPASERQLRFIAELANERGVLAPDGPLTKAQASKVIEQLKAGSYVADEWTAPF